MFYDDFQQIEALRSRLENPVNSGNEEILAKIQALFSEMKNLEVDQSLKKVWTVFPLLKKKRIVSFIFCNDTFFFLWKDASIKYD